MTSLRRRRRDGRCGQNERPAVSPRSDGRRLAILRHGDRAADELPRHRPVRRCCGGDPTGTACLPCAASGPDGTCEDAETIAFAAARADSDWPHEPRAPSGYRPPPRAPVALRWLQRRPADIRVIRHRDDARSCPNRMRSSPVSIWLVLAPAPWTYTVSARRHASSPQTFAHLPARRFTAASALSAAQRRPQRSAVSGPSRIHVDEDGRGDRWRDGRVNVHNHPRVPEVVLE
jgi:hypothetical protein